ncbi:hypothetical protein [Dyella sp. A6]|uniref:hypothetical protein n=1 Tax=Dyella aluminiiresistens TaxID=3069105 RepID=UPI002E779B05|nr:hypothetical protein [Dyella sp. A6]
MMAYNTSRRAGPMALVSAMLTAMQWRLLLLWLLFVLLPVAVVSLPLLRMLGGLLDHSVHADAWARHFNALMFGDTIMALSGHAQWFGATAILGLLLTLLLSPFLDGMMIGSGRSGRALGFGTLLQSGWAEYGRMFRVMLWSLLPYALVLAVGVMGQQVAGSHARQAVLQAQADAWAHGAHWVLLAVFVLAQTVVESMRAAFIADPDLRSATRALGRGVLQLLRRPLRTVLFYLVVTCAGMLMFGGLGLLRIHTEAVGTHGLLLALLLGQLMVLVVGWMRFARLLALAEVVRSWRPGRRGGAIAPAR